MRDICLDEFRRRAEKLWTSLCTDCVSEQRLVSLATTFGDYEDDYIRDQLIDNCYSSHLRRKFLEKEVTVTLGDLLRVATSQEEVDRQLKPPPG